MFIRLARLLVRLVLFSCLVGGLIYLILINHNKIPLVTLPSVISIHISSEQVLGATNQYRLNLGLKALTKKDELCQLGENILAVIKSHWQTVVFDTTSKDFYRLHPEYSNLAMQAADENFDSLEKINNWLNEADIKKEIISPDYNSICVVTDGSYLAQILGTFNVPLKAILIKPSPSPSPADTSPWGVSKQIDEHTWSIKVGQDSTMATPAEIFTALNTYRQRYGSQILTWDQTLADYAQKRAEYINGLKKTDDHQGFFDFLNNQDGFNKLGFTSLGENMFYGYRLSGVHIIEWVYAGDEPHNSNQMDNKWNYVGIGVNGLGNSIIFGTGRR